VGSAGPLCRRFPGGMSVQLTWAYFRRIPRGAESGLYRDVSSGSGAVAIDAERRAEVAVPSALLDAIVRYYDPIQTYCSAVRPGARLVPTAIGTCSWSSTTPRHRRS
jgi:hypothetical protein